MYIRWLKSKGNDKTIEVDPSTKSNCIFSFFSFLWCRLYFLFFSLRRHIWNSRSRQSSLPMKFRESSTQKKNKYRILKWPTAINATKFQWHIWKLFYLIGILKRLSIYERTTYIFQKNTDLFLGPTVFNIIF